MATDFVGNSISIAYNDKNQVVRLTNINDDDIIISFGSLYYIGEVRAMKGNILK